MRIFSFPVCKIISFLAHKALDKKKCGGKKKEKMSLFQSEMLGLLKKEQQAIDALVYGDSGTDKSEIFARNVAKGLKRLSATEQAEAREKIDGT